ncbi:uncharacterized protein STEHIDRAFT_38627, partial [Stereum hirsutum FP-91666 SS1]|uniref:uncharacterized protein n=1 Tax=Stereum hirsutum (strain FP-91666) TaxID=721885 RepID=UPI0004449BB1
VTSTDGTKIWAECLGATDKPCIVWVHGLSCSALPFDKQFVDEEFLKEYKMIRYETRGHGRSDAPMNKE